MQVGMNDYVSKPIDTAKLLERIAFWLGAERDTGFEENPVQADNAVDAVADDDAVAALDDPLDTLDDVAGDQDEQMRV